MMPNAHVKMEMKPSIDAFCPPPMAPPMMTYSLEKVSYQADLLIIDDVKSIALRALLCEAGVQLKTCMRSPDRTQSANVYTIS